MKSVHHHQIHHIYYILYYINYILYSYCALFPRWAVTEGQNHKKYCKEELLASNNSGDRLVYIENTKTWFLNPVYMIRTLFLFLSIGAASAADVLDSVWFLVNRVLPRLIFCLLLFIFMVCLTDTVSSSLYI